MSNKERVERKLAAILHADVQGYSRLMGEDEETTLHTLTAHRKVMDALIEQHRGRIVGTAGDSVLAEFASAIDAVQGAVDIQHAELCCSTSAAGYMCAILTVLARLEGSLLATGRSPYMFGAACALW